CGWNEGSRAKRDPDAGARPFGSFGRGRPSGNCQKGLAQQGETNASANPHNRAPPRNESQPAAVQGATCSSGGGERGVVRKCIRQYSFASKNSAPPSAPTKSDGPVRYPTRRRSARHRPGG